MAPRATKAASGILRHSSRPRQITGDGGGGDVADGLAGQHDDGAPAAAAVAPLTKALICGLPRWQAKQRPGKTTPR